MCSIENHPSMLVSSHSLTFLVEILTHDTLKPNFAESILKNLLNQVFYKLVKFELLSKNDAFQYYAEIDMDSDTEKAQSFHIISTRRKNVLKAIAELNISVAVSWLYEHARNCFINPADFDQKMIIALSQSCETILGVILVDNLSSETFETIGYTLNLLLELIISFQSTEIPLIEANLKMIVSFGPILSKFPSLVFPAIEKILFKYVVFSQFSESDPNLLSAETVKLRKEAAFSLVRLGSCLTEYLKDSFLGITSSISTLIQQNRIRESEKYTCVEFLIVLVAHSDIPYTEKLLHVRSFIKDDVSILEGFLGQLSSIDDFYFLIGLVPLSKISHDPRNINADSQSMMQKCSNNRKKVNI